MKYRHIEELISILYDSVDATVLFVASQKGHVKVVQLLIEGGGNINNKYFKG